MKRELEPEAGSRLAAPDRDRSLVLSGAELVDLAEHYKVRAFVVALDLLQFTVAVAAVVTPLSHPPAGLAFTLIVLAGIAGATAFARRRRLEVYRLLCRRPIGSFATACAVAMALLIDDPASSPLWWVALATLSVCAVISSGACTAACAGVLAVGYILGMQYHGHLTLLAHDPRFGVEAAAFAPWALLVHGTIEGTTCFMLRFGQALANRPPSRPARVWASPDAPGPTTPFAALPGDATASPTVDQTLTARQLEVVVLLCDGLRQREIADALAISVRQVERHIRNAKDRLEAQSNAELVRIAIVAGFVSALEADSGV